MRPLYLSLLLASLLIVFSSLGQAAVPQDVRMGLITWPGHGVVFVGIEKGFFPGLNIQTTTLDSTPERNSAWLSGKLDMLVQTVDVMPVEYAQGMTGKLFMATDTSFGGDGILAKNTIQSVKDLKGKTISVARGQPSFTLLYQALKQNGMTIADVSIQSVDDPSLAAQAFIAGSVDAAVTYEPYLSKSIKAAKKSHILFTSKDYPEALIDAIRVSDDFMAKNPDAVKTFIQGWQKSIAYTQTHPAEAAAIMDKGFKVSPGDMLDSMKGLKFLTPEQTNAYFCAKPAKIVSIYDDAAQMWVAERVIDKTPPIGSQIISTIGCGLFDPAVK